jgi:hypothetical protein
MPEEFRNPNPRMNDECPSPNDETSEIKNLAGKTKSLGISMK